MLRNLFSMDIRGAKLIVFLAGLVLAIGGGGGAPGAEAVVSQNTKNKLETEIAINGTGSETDAAKGAVFDQLSVNNGTFEVSSDVVLSGKGKLTVSNSDSYGSMKVGGLPDKPAKNFTVSGDGTLTVGNATKSGGMEAGRFVMTGGTVNVGGTANDTAEDRDRWTTKTSFITGGWQGMSDNETTANASVSLTGGTVNLLDGGRIQTTAQGPAVTGDMSRYSGLFHIGGDVTINMEGKNLPNASVLKAQEYHGGRAQEALEALPGWYTKMLIDGDAKININKYGVILSRDTTMNGGSINVGTDGVLQVHGGWAESSPNLAAGLSDNRIKNWGDFNINGGTINNNGGIIDFVTGNMTVNAAGGEHIGNLIIANTDKESMVKGNTYSTNLNISGGTFTLDGTTKVGTGGKFTIAKNSTLQFGKTMTIESGGKLNLTSSSKLIWNGESGKAIINSSGIEFSDTGTTLDAYLAKQNISNLIQKTKFSNENNNISVNVEKFSSAAAGMSNILTSTGSAHMASGLSAGVVNTWGSIINSNSVVGDILRNNLKAEAGAAETQSVVSTLAGFDSAKSLDVAMITANNVTGRINARVADNNLARGQTGNSSGFSSGGAWAAPRDPRLDNSFANRFWMGAFGLWEDADQRGFDNGYKYRSGGFIAGYDRVIGAFTVGGSYAFTAGDYEDKNSLSSDSEIASYAFTGYGTYNHWSGFFGTLMLGYTYSDYDMANLVTRAGQWDRSSFHANTWTIGGTVGYDFRPTRSLSVSPSVGLYYYTSSTNTFATTLRRDMQVDQDSGELPIDVAVNYDVPLAGANLRLSANTGYARSLGGTDGGDLDGFGYNGVNGARISGIKGRDKARNTWNLGLGARYSWGPVDAGLKYDYSLKSDYDAHRLTGTVGFNF